MSDTSAQNRCPSCGAEIPPGAPQGLCPRCVLEGVAHEAAETEEATRAAAERGMQPPSLEDIAAAFPQFEVVELIGSGGMGAVFKVRQPRLDRTVALKVLPRTLATDERFTERFTREAQALARLNHPNIVAVHDFGESGGFHYLLMEFVDGANLREAMQAGKFTPEQAFAVVPEICAALQYAHDEGVLHRDIKPENLLLDTKGRVKIVDFGIAKLVGQELAGGTPLTRTIAPGTPQYMAPEQIEHRADVDHRADIYSLGVVFYEMLTGELPIGRFAAPSEKAAVGGRVDDIVFRSLEKEPGRRQQSAGEVKTQVEGLGSEPPPIRTPPVRTSPVGGRTAHSRRGGRAVLLLLASALLLVAASGFTLLLTYQTRSATPRAAQLAAEIETLQAEAALLPDGAEADRTKERLALLEEELRTQQPGESPWGGMLGIVTGFVVVCVICAVMAFVGTSWGWRALRELRLSGEHRGRASALVAALLIPMLALSALIFVVVVLPASGAWSGPAISLAILGILAANTWLVLSVRQWLASPPVEAELHAYQSRVAARGPEVQPARSGIGWALLLIAIFLLGPLVLIAGCGVVVALVYRDKAKVEEQDPRAEVSAATNNARRIAAAEAVGDDLSTRERELVGSWHFYQGPDAGIFHYDADRTWRLQSTTGGFEASGTWRIVDKVLENAITECNEEEQVGMTIRSDILKLDDDVMVEIREQGSEGTLVLRPLADLSDSEWSLVGPWLSLEKQENERFTFHTDRSFEVRTPGDTDRGRWRIDEVKKVFEMTIEESPKKFHRGLEVRGRITELDETTFIFENSVGGGLITLVRDGVQQAPSP